jgi:tRNA A-37 threonylcarbamoyl transferase component Bud32
VGRLDCLDALQAGQADFLHALPATSAPASGEGRGPVSRFALRGIPVIGKRSRHGGAAGILGGMFIGRRRGLDQIQAAERLRRAGVATPAILAVGVKAAGPLVLSQVIVAEEVVGALSLLASARNGTRAQRELLRAAGEAVRRMHDAGFRHADLNVGNILMVEATEGPRIHVVDLEKGVFRERLHVAERAGNIARLLRSYLKWLDDHEPLSARQELRFLRAYCRADRALLRDLQGRVQRHRRTWFRIHHRVGDRRRRESAGGSQ